MSARPARLQPHYENLAKQTDAARLGMWLFLASEVLLFSALFTLYASYRTAAPEVFRAAVRHTSYWHGAAMTVLLITSSLAVALAVAAIRRDQPLTCVGWLATCISLGLAFLGLKALEYGQHFAEGIYPGVYYRFAALPEPAAVVFFTLYYLMTGLHALHVLGGIVFLGLAAWAVQRRRFDSAYHTPIELGALYWHLVDVIWIFLWPVFYLLH